MRRGGRRGGIKKERNRSGDQLGWSAMLRPATVSRACIRGGSGIYGGIYMGPRVMPGLGIVRGTIPSAEVVPIISQLAADCVQSTVEL